MVDLFRRQALEQSYLQMLASLPEAQQPSEEIRQIQLETLQQVDRMLDTLSEKAVRLFCSLSWTACNIAILQKSWAYRSVQ